MSDIDTLQAKARELEGLVEQWFVETFHGSIVASKTEIWNAVHAAKEDLKQRLGAHLLSSTESTLKS